MDFSTKPPTDFEIGQTKEYYEERTSNFSYFDLLPRAKSFEADATVEGVQRKISGKFSEDRVTALKLQLFPEDTFSNFLLDIPPEQFYYELRNSYTDVKIRRTQRNGTGCSIEEPHNAMLIELFYDKDKPVAINWTLRMDNHNG